MSKGIGDIFSMFVAILLLFVVFLVAFTILEVPKYVTGGQGVLDPAVINSENLVGFQEQEDGLEQIITMLGMETEKGDFGNLIASKNKELVLKELKKEFERLKITTKFKKHGIKIVYDDGEVKLDDKIGLEISKVTIPAFDGSKIKISWYKILSEKGEPTLLDYALVE